MQNKTMPPPETIVDPWIDKVKNIKYPPKAKPEDKLKLLQESFSEWLLYENPEFATIINDRRYDDRLDDFSLDLFDRWKDQVDCFLNKLEGIKRDTLPAGFRIDYDIFKDFLETYHSGYEWRMYNALNPINFLEGPQSDPGTVVKKMPKYTIGDFENFIARIKSMPDQLLQIKKRFMKAIAMNRTYHEVSVIPVLKQIDKMTTEKAEDFVFYKPFKTDLDKISTITAEEKKMVQDRAKTAINNLIRTLDDMKHFLNQTYMPHARQQYGVSSWSNGTEFYKASLQWHLSLPLSPEEVHQKGLEEVERISTEMKKIFANLGLTGTIKDGFESLKNDSSYFLQSSDDIVSAFKNIVQQQIEPKLKLLFKDIPDLPLVIEPMPYNGPSGQYLAGSSDGTKPGTFQINVFHPEEFPTFIFPSLALHETLPGHHFQISVQSLAKMPGFRRNGLDNKYFQPPTLFPFYTAFVEGWGLYSEYLGEEMGLYETDAQKLGRYSDEILRACRLVIDTGLHYMSWSREKAVEYMSHYIAGGENEISTEIDRYITWPGQACAYKIGELKIKELRTKANNELGSRFDIRDFHSVVLKNGPMPLTTLETVVDNWIKEVKEKVTPIQGPTKYTKRNVHWNVRTCIPISLITCSLLFVYYYRRR